MILLGSKIQEEVEAGNICISPFDKMQLGPNSYDVRLAPTLAVYEKFPLRMDAENPTRQIIIPENGLELLPGELYLGSTIETATSHKYVPFLDGRSSSGRLGINIHVTAGVGDVGWGGVPSALTYPRWTLEVTVAKPVVVFPGRRIGQVYFIVPDHVPDQHELYHGKYNNQREAQPSLMFLDREVVGGHNDKH